jgi:FtsZ-interacting cell division protein YlmF
MNEDFKRKLEAKAQREKKSLNQVVNEFLSFASMIDDLTQDESNVTIDHPKGYEDAQKVIVPTPQQMFQHQ